MLSKQKMTKLKAKPSETYLLFSASSACVDSGCLGPLGGLRGPGVVSQSS